MSVSELKYFWSSWVALLGTVTVTFGVSSDGQAKSLLLEGPYSKVPRSSGTMHRAQLEQVLRFVTKAILVSQYHPSQAFFSSHSASSCKQILFNLHPCAPTLSGSDAHIFVLQKLAAKWGGGQYLGLKTCSHTAIGPSLLLVAKSTAVEHVVYEVLPSARLSLACLTCSIFSWIIYLGTFCLFWPLSSPPFFFSAIFDAGVNFLLFLESITVYSIWSINWWEEEGFF